MNATKKANAVVKVSARFAALVSTGIAPVAALRIIFGAEMVDQMIDSLYDELRKGVA